MAAYGTIEEALAGLISEGIQASNTESRAIQDAAGIEFGASVWGYLGNTDKCYNYYLDTAKLVWDADLVASNSIVLTIDGVALSAVVFATDHDTTMDLLIAAIIAAGYDAGLDATDANNRTIYVREKGSVRTLAEAITGGGSQATGTITYQSDEVFLGVAQYTAKNLAVAGAGTYLQYETVNIYNRGKIWALSNGTILADDDVYIIASGTYRGKFSATAGLTVDCKSRSDNITVQTSTVITKVETRGIYKPNTQIVWE